MKKYILWSLAICLLAFSCDDDRELTTLSLGDAPVITAPEAGFSATITEDNLNDPFTTITWTLADFGYNAAIRYEVEMDVAGGDFTAAQSSGVINGLTKIEVTNTQINNAMLSLGRPGGTFSQMDLRVRATIENGDILISDPVTVNINPVEAEIDYPKLNVPGAYQGWDPENFETVIFSVNQDETYEGYLYFEAPTQFKYAVGSWATNWGDTGADGTLEPDGDNISAPEAGVYRLNADIPGLLHSFAKTDWGLIGDATPGGWDSDTDMTYDPVTKLWSVTLDLTAGEIKFRANDDWAINMGDDGANLKLEYEGANIAVAEAGNYTVELDLSQAIYRYTVTKN